MRAERSVFELMILRTAQACCERGGCGRNAVWCGENVVRRAACCERDVEDERVALSALKLRFAYCAVDFDQAKWGVTHRHILLLDTNLLNVYKSGDSKVARSSIPPSSSCLITRQPFRTFPPKMRHERVPLQAPVRFLEQAGISADELSE
ncbi:hypothetical protein K458DRAFT_132812 [Lentithecium fluviatile CBS 122367]|uniref:Uncharacterized protein n=1 Tax=Lentithecium fluviatile CBS 122367 TaxID=1168545 RepID=A0A6G1ILE3_9PLEO|nr:hypothetical protein K458DRAFT_132812 [Lentithecium fluviatile CBS 122367]